jgi:hypothetical protein
MACQEKWPEQEKLHPVRYPYTISPLALITRKLYQTDIGEVARPEQSSAHERGYPLVMSTYTPTLRLLIIDFMTVCFGQGCLRLRTIYLKATLGEISFTCIKI